MIKWILRKLKFTPQWKLLVIQKNNIVTGNDGFASLGKFGIASKLIAWFIIYRSLRGFRHILNLHHFLQQNCHDSSHNHHFSTNLESQSWVYATESSSNTSQINWRCGRNSVAQVIVLDLVDWSGSSANVQEVLFDDWWSSGVHVAQSSSFRSKNSEIDLAGLQTASDKVVQSVYYHVEVAFLVKAHALEKKGKKNWFWFKVFRFF